MNVREMHIEVNQQLQKVAAHRTRKFFNEEIDAVLNNMVNRFIQLQLRPKPNGSFQIDQLGADAIRNLIVTNRDLTAYYTAGVGYTSYLPANYAYLLSDSSSVHNLCGRGITEQTTPLAHMSFPAYLSNKQDPKYYTKMEITLGSDTLYIPGGLTNQADYDGFHNKKDISFLVPYILNFFHNKNQPLYWERHGDIYMPNTFIWAKPAIEYLQISIDENREGASQRTFQLKTHTTTGTARMTANRLTPSEEVQALLNTAFYKTSFLSPISELSANTIKTYTDGSFIVTGTRVTYIKQPQNISLALGTSCDLAPEFHQKICDLAVENIKVILEDTAGAQLKAQDNDRRVII